MSKNNTWKKFFIELCVITARQASLSINKSRSLLKLMCVESGDAIQPSHPLSSPSPVFNLSQYQALFQ